MVCPTPPMRPRISLTIIMFLALGTASWGQSYFRQFGMPSSLGTVIAPAPEEESSYNMAIGPVRFGLTAGVGIEWNDNIKLSDKDKLSDFILRPSVNLNSAWVVSELNTIRFSIGAGYAKYFSYSEYDAKSLLFTPNSALAMTFQVNEVKITVRDRFSYQEDPYDVAVVSDTGNFRRFENQASLQLDWNVTPYIILTGGYAHYDLWALDDAFSSQTRSIDSLFFRPGYQITPTINVGVNTSASTINFQKNIQNDATNFMAGPFLQWSITDATEIYLEAGLQGMNFKNNGTISDSQNSNASYFKTEVNNRLSETFTQRFSLNRNAEVGFGSNFYDIYHAEYSALWQPSVFFNVSPSFFYEYYETSGETSEKANRLGAALALRYILSPSLTLGLDYRFLLKHGEFEESDYHQNLLLLSIYYNF